METKHYINLTNGLEFLRCWPYIKYSFIRIQSTHCEQKRYEDIVMSLSDDLLMNLALGHECIIYDASKHGESRALWQGVEFIRTAIRLVWFCKETSVDRGMSVDFKERIKGLSKKALNRIKYYRKFLCCNDIILHTSFIETANDGNYTYFLGELKKYNG